jgi:putative transposase
MKEYQSLSHTRWDCKYHVVFIPKRRKKQIFGALRRQLGQILRELAQHKESVVVEGHLMPDHDELAKLLHDLLSSIAALSLRFFGASSLTRVA